MKQDPSVTERVGSLGRGYGLSQGQLAMLNTILTVLATDEHAPTTVRDPPAAVDVHLADSLSALELGVLRKASSVADIGAGAGFPGLPLAVAMPWSEVRLVESQARKCEFISGLCEEAGISNARVVNTRVEEWSEGAGAHDAVLARALAPQPVVLEYAAPLLRADGHLVDWRGRRIAEDERMSDDAASELGLERVEVVHVQPYAGARDHYLHLFRKVAATPPRFPRRAGVARKRPLGS